MRELLEEASTAGRLRRGEVVEGVVVQVGRDEILVDVGSKAEAIIPAAEAGVPQNEIPNAIHVGETIVAMVVEPEDREGHATLSLARAQTERGWRTLPRPYEAARAREYRGRSLLAEDPAAGRRLLVGAMDGYRALGAQWDAGRVRATLRQRGLIPPHRAGRRGYGGELSPREHEVVQLASDGLSNPEIAVSLTVSRSTVEHHMSSAMRKLGASSRHELGELLDAVSGRATGTN